MWMHMSLWATTPILRWMKFRPVCRICVRSQSDFLFDELRHWNSLWHHRWKLWIPYVPQFDRSLNAASQVCKQKHSVLYIDRGEKNTTSKCWMCRNDQPWAFLFFILFKYESSHKSNTTFCQSEATKSRFLASSDRTQHSRKQTKHESLWSTLNMQNKSERETKMKEKLPVWK